MCGESINNLNNPGDESTILGCGRRDFWDGFLFEYSFPLFCHIGTAIEFWSTMSVPPE